MYDVRKIANAILDLSDARGYAITNMALNKLVFFSHGWHLAVYDQSLVDSNFEAWQFGPVHPHLYRQFKRYGDRPIDGRAVRIDLATGADVPMQYQLDSRASAHVEQMVSFYGQIPAARLSAISHESGAPWDEIWNGSGSRPGMTIPNELTKIYYRSKMERPS